VKPLHFEFFLFDNNDAVETAITIVSDLQMLGYFYLPDANLAYSARNEVELMMTVLRKDSKTYRTALEEKGMLFLLYYILSHVP
jgi:predicted RNA-binding protein with EMAP domain